MFKMVRTIVVSIAVMMLMGINIGITPTLAPRIREANGTSSNWSGYAIETNLSSPQNNAVSDVKGTWVEPAVSCTSQTTYSSFWIGIDGYSDNTVEQIGTDSDCMSGNPSYYAWYEMYPKPSFRINLAIHAGDTVTAEVQYIGGKKFTLTLKNVTTGQSFTTTQSSNGHRQSAEWVAEAPSSGGVLPLANFGSVSFTGSSAVVNGHTGTINDSAWTYDAITMASGGTTKAVPSALSADGSSFSVSWKSS